MPYYGAFFPAFFAIFFRDFPRGQRNYTFHYGQIMPVIIMHVLFTCTGGSTFFGSRKAAFFVISWALGHRKSPLFSKKMANKPAAEVDIAVLIDGELRDLIRQRGLEIPRKATRPDLVALLRTSLDEDKEVSEPTSKSPLAANEGVVASLCSALSELTNVVRELKTELHTMREIEAKFNDSASPFPNDQSRYNRFRGFFCRETFSSLRNFEFV